MIKKEFWKASCQDNLVLRVIDKRTGNILTQGKRLPAGASEDLKKIQRLYVEKSLIHSIKFIKENYDLSLRDAKNCFDLIRGDTTSSWIYH